MLNHLKPRTIPLLAILGAAALVNGCIIDDMRVGSCDEGHCTQVCGFDDLCTLSCDGGGCEQTCRAHSECVLSCDGGDCDQTCLPGANCTVSCDGGDCDQTCESHECIFDCEHDCDDPY